MLRTILLVPAAFALLSACDAGRGIERLSETDLVLPETQTAAALPTPEETGDAGGFLTRLLSRAEPAPTPTTVTDAPAAELATGTDATAAAPSEATAQAPAAQIQQTETGADAPPRRSLFSRFTGTGSGPLSEPEPDIPAPPVATTEPAEVIVTAEQPADAPETPPTPTRRAGLLGLFAGGDRGVARPELASLGPAPTERGRDSGAAPVQALPPRTADKLDVPPGTMLPFGQIARVCDAARRDFGKQIEKAPARGQGFTLYDSNPGSTAPRTWYVTGFADGCPRQFTAALALFGAPSTYENLRFVLPASAYGYTEADRSYDQIKSRICGAPRRQPCGARIDRLERNTVFVSSYERFESTARWADILLHDGAVLAKVIKTP
ncbi:MAG: hypothetical protein AAFY38_08680 [Pseudomonadota bacterium]